MAEYRVKNMTILHDGVARGEGEIIELSAKQAKKLANFVEAVEKNTNTTNNSEDKNGQTVNASQNQTESKEPVKEKSDKQSGSKNTGNKKQGGNNGK